ncbi:hypothetical protein L1887_50165 [Cichorium endivia]|nr:hypothetical protein L1887_50165 [Cichorium endivia]
MGMRTGESSDVDARRKASGGYGEMEDGGECESDAGGEQETRRWNAELCNGRLGGSERSGTEAGRQDQDQSARRERECAEAGALEPVACVDSLSRAIGFFTSATAASPLSPPPASGAAGT